MASSGGGLWFGFNLQPYGCNELGFRVVRCAHDPDAPRGPTAQTAQEWPELQTAVSSLCQLWWLKELPGREQLVAQLTVYLCARALTSGQPLDPSLEP